MNENRIKLAIDAMGGDFAPKEIVEGVNLAIKNNEDLEFPLPVDEDTWQVESVRPGVL